VDVRYSAEQVALRESVAQVVDRLGPKAVGQLDEPERTAKLDAAVESSGWRELRAAHEGGGPWASGVEVAIVAEELARGLAEAPFVGPTLAAELRRLVGAEAATAPETVALTADLTTLGADVAVDAGLAEAVLVLHGDEVRLAGVGERLQPVDLTRPSAAVGATTTSLGTLDAEGTARFTALGLSLLCADLVGTMTGATTLATEYAKERRQYGAPIGSYQAVQHLLADAFTLTEGSRSIALHAAWAVDALPPAEAVAAAAAAKAYCTRSARTVCETVIQVHGGIGNTWEHLAHVHLRRAVLSGDVLGGVGPCLSRVLEHQGIGGDRGLR
jgi:alkylation response protein AidB-like acyl-CoA dehydrogenase